MVTQMEKETRVRRQHKEASGKGIQECISCDVKTAIIMTAAIIAPPSR